MHSVGSHLAAFAIQHRGKRDDIDDFARSAFNRYYYGIYWSTRRLISETIGTEGLRHSQLPSHLSGDFARMMRKQIRGNFKSGLFNKSEMSEFLTSLNDNISLLASLLVEGYQVRCTADYHPEILAVITNSKIQLANTTEEKAKKWGGRANLHCKNLHKIWTALGN